MTKRTRVPQLLLVIGLALSLAACRTSPGIRSLAPREPGTTAGPTVSLDPNAESCKLITHAEAEAAFKQTFLPEAGTVGDPSSCDYFNSAGFGLSVEISHAATVAADFETEKTGFGSTAKDLAGIGDKAFEFTQGAHQITFLKGTTLVTLYAASRIDDQAFRDLAKLAESRL